MDGMAGGWSSFSRNSAFAHFSCGGSSSGRQGAAESRLERSIRFGKLFNEAQESLNRGDLVKAAAMFGDLAAQPDCPCPHPFGPV